MWAVAGVLLGLVGLSAVAGFHLGPHAHAASAIFGAAAAVTLLVLAFTGHADALLFALLASDVVVTGGVAAIATKGFADRNRIGGRSADPIVGDFGTAIDTLDPAGTVRLHGEIWSATALNPPVAAGREVHVIRRSSVRLEVWGDTGVEPEDLFTIPPAPETGHGTQNGQSTTGDAGGERTT